MEKNIKKNVYLCITESLCCTAEMNTTLEINYTSIKKFFKIFYKWQKIPKCLFYNKYLYQWENRNLDGWDNLFQGHTAS